jgi:hypothetical protein
LARQQDRKLAELASLRDDVNVLTAIIQRLDTKVIRLLAEIRATHSQVVGADWVTGAAVRPCLAATNGSFG